MVSVDKSRGMPRKHTEFSKTAPFWIFQQTRAPHAATHHTALPVFSLLLHPFGCHLLWPLHLAESPALTCQHFFLPPHCPTQLGNSSLVAKRERCVRHLSLCETPNTLQSDSSFLVSTRPGHCQIQSLGSAGLLLSIINVGKHLHQWKSQTKGFFFFFTSEKLNPQSVRYLLLSTELCNDRVMANT